MAVHDIQVQPIRPRSVRAPDLFGELAEICREQRRRNDHALHRKKSPAKSRMRTCRLIRRTRWCLPFFFSTLWAGDGQTVMNVRINGRTAHYRTVTFDAARN